MKSEIAVKNRLKNPQKYVAMKYSELNKNIAISNHKDSKTFGMLFKTIDKEYALYLSREDAEQIMLCLIEYFNEQ
jgi:hypothetical protein